MRQPQAQTDRHLGLFYRGSPTAARVRALRRRRCIGEEAAKPDGAESRAGCGRSCGAGDASAAAVITSFPDLASLFPRCLAAATSRYYTRAVVCVLSGVT